MPARRRTAVLTLAAVVSWCAAPPARADDALDDHRVTARSWAGAAGRVAAGTLDRSLPDVYVARALDAAADGLDDVARWIDAHANRDRAAYATSAHDVAATRATVRRLARTTAAHDAPATRDAIALLKRQAADLAGGTAR